MRKRQFCQCLQGVRGFDVLSPYDKTIYHRMIKPIYHQAIKPYLVKSEFNDYCIFKSTICIKGTKVQKHGTVFRVIVIV